MSIEIIRDPDRDDVVRRIEAAAFDEGEKCEHCDGTGTVPGGRRVVHSQLGGLGADWDAEKLVALVRSSPTVAWGDGFMEHDLAVMNEDRRWVKFRVPHPDREVES